MINGRIATTEPVITVENRACAADPALAALCCCASPTVSG